MHSTTTRTKVGNIINSAYMEPTFNFFKKI